MTQATGGTSRLQLMINLGLMGMGMGFSVSPFLIAVQSSVPRREMGTATATLQFCRNIGGTLGVSVMGAVLAARLAAALTAVGVDPESISLDSLVDPLSGGEAASALDGTIRVALGGAIQGVFVVAFVAAALSWLVSALAPGGHIGLIAPPSAAEGSDVTPDLVPTAGHD